MPLLFFLPVFCNNWIFFSVYDIFFLILFLFFTNNAYFSRAIAMQSYDVSADTPVFSMDALSVKITSGLLIFVIFGRILW